MISILVMSAALVSASYQDPPSAPEPAPAPLTVAALAAVPPLGEAEPILGARDAKVTIIEYTSFVCRPCSAWRSDVLPDILSRHIETGQANLVLRQMPSGNLAVSVPAAAIARCARPENYYEVAKALFEHQPALLAGGLIEEWYAVGIAASGRTREEIETCFADEATLSELKEEVRIGKAAGIQGVPAFFVNGVRIEDYTAETLGQAIEAATASPSLSGEPAASGPSADAIVP